MADVSLPSVATVTAAAGDKMAIVQGGAVKLALVSDATVFSGNQFQAGSATNALLKYSSAGPTRMHIEPNGYPTGTAAKLDLMFDDYQSDGTNYHIANFYTKNYDATDTSTTQGNNGVAVIGLKAVGRNYGIWPTLHIGYSDDGAAGAVPMKVYYFDTSDTTWRTPMKGMWRTGVAITTGDYTLSANKLYQASTTATTGVTAPSHASGSASDGGVTWDFVRDFAAASNSIKGCVVFGDRDDLPKFGLSTVRVQIAGDAAIWNAKKLKFLDGSSAAAWNVYTAVGTDDLYIENGAGTKRLRLDATGEFLQINGLSVASVPVTATDADTTPSIKGVRKLVFSNTGATSVTNFDDGINSQEFYVHTSNANTTLVHGANLRLAGGVNKVMGTDDMLHFVMNSGGTIAYQV